MRTKLDYLISRLSASASIGLNVGVDIFLNSIGIASSITGLTVGGFVSLIGDRYPSISDKLTRVAQGEQVSIRDIEREQIREFIANMDISAPSISVPTENGVPQISNTVVIGHTVLDTPTAPDIDITLPGFSVDQPNITLEEFPSDSFSPPQESFPDASRSLDEIGTESFPEAEELPYVYNADIALPFDEIPQAPGTKRLYNASPVEYDPQGYLEPHISAWVEEVADGTGYEGDMSDIVKPLIYLNDDPSAWIQMIVARATGKAYNEVTLSDVREHGRLNIVDVEFGEPVYQVGDYFNDQSVTDLEGNRRRFWDTELYSSPDVYTGEGGMTELPVGPEPSDYISSSVLGVTRSLTGDDLINFLKIETPELYAELLSREPPVEIEDIPMFEENEISAEMPSLEEFESMEQPVDQYIPTEEDTAYEQVVSAGDTETAEEMIRNAAEAAGFDTTRIMYHGTTHDFTTFKLELSNIGGDRGQAYYFTSSFDDGKENYANMGADLTQKIELAIDNMMEADDSLSREEARAIATSRLYGGTSNLFSVYLRTANPIVIGGENQTYIEPISMYNEDDLEDLKDQAIERVKEEYDITDAELIDYQDEIREAQEELADENCYWNEEEHPVLTAVKEVARDYYDVDADAIEELRDYITTEGMSAFNLDSLLRRIFDFAHDGETGELVSGEAGRRVYEALGYDSIIDYDVSRRFSNMDGVYEDTYHVIVFDANQIKLADAVTYDANGNIIPLSRRFDSGSDIRGRGVVREQEVEDIPMFEDIDPVGETSTEGSEEPRSSIIGLPDNIDASNTRIASDTELGRFDVRVTGVEYSSLGYGPTVEISIESPRTESVIEQTYYNDYDENKEFPRNRTYDSSIIDENGEIVDDRYSFPDEVFSRDAVDGFLYRGVSAAEMRNILANGYIESNGSMNFNFQQGQTIFANNPGQAESYAGGFAPWAYRPTYEEPNYIIEIIRPEGLTETNGNEVAIEGRIPTSHITRIWELRLAQERAGSASIIYDSTIIPENDVYTMQNGSSQAPAQWYLTREVSQNEIIGNDIETANDIATEATTESSVSALDAEYAAAVEAGDQEKIDEIVDRAASDAGFIVAYHGSPETDIESFNVNGKTAYGSFFSPDENTAAYYGDRLYKVYLDMGNVADLDDPFVFDKVAREAIWDLGETRANKEELGSFLQDLHDEGYGKNDVVTKFFDEQGEGTMDEIADDLDFWEIELLIEQLNESIPDAAEWLNDYCPVRYENLDYARESYMSGSFYMDYQDDFMYAAENMGYDSVIFSDPSPTGESISYVIFNPSRIVIAGTAPRDAYGNIIPLSERLGRHTEATVEKQPWEMNPDEYSEANPDAGYNDYEEEIVTAIERGETIPIEILEDVDLPLLVSAEEMYDYWDAIGQPIPREILDRYPELKLWEEIQKTRSWYRGIEYNRELETAAIEEFGTTDDPREAGYILQDGTMLDFSGKVEGGSPGTRSYDHRQIGSIMDDLSGYDSLVEFASKTGSIRASISGNSMIIDIYGPITRSQFEQLQDASFYGVEEIYYDITRNGTNVDSGMIYPGMLPALKQWTDEVYDKDYFVERPGFLSYEESSISASTKLDRLIRRLEAAETKMNPRYKDILEGIEDRYMWAIMSIAEELKYGQLFWDIYLYYNGFSDGSKRPSNELMYQLATVGSKMEKRLGPDFIQFLWWPSEETFTYT